MVFNVGETVVYPHHGAALIQATETRTVKGLEKLASGDVNKVAEVVRDLWRRDRERGLSAGEKRMLAKARQILVSELALAEGTNELKAEGILDEVLASCRVGCGSLSYPFPLRDCCCDVTIAALVPAAGTGERL